MPGQVEHKSIAFDEACLREIAGPLARDGNQKRRDIDADAPAMGADLLRELQQRLPGATADVDDSVADTWRKCCDGAEAEGRQLPIKRLADFGPCFRCETMWKGGPAKRS